MAAPFPVTDLARCKAWMAANTAQPGDQTNLDTKLAPMISAISRALPEYLSRPIEAVARVETYAPVRLQRTLQLRAYPVSVVTEVREAYDRDFTQDATILNTDLYTFVPESGILAYDRGFYGGYNTVQVSYTGGLAADLDALEVDYPDIVQAATIWAVAMFKRSSVVGQTQVSAGARGKSLDLASFRSAPPAEAEALLAPHRAARIGHQA